MGHKVPFLNSNNSGASSSDRYFPVAMSQGSLETTQSRAQQTIRLGGTFSKLTCYIAANSTTSSSTFTFQKNGSNGNQTITIGSAATGLFEDASNTDSVTAGDEVNSFLDVGSAHNINITFGGAYFEATSNTVLRIAGGTTLGLSTNSVTRYILPVGFISYLSSEDDDVQMPIKAACTAKNFFVNISSNARSTTTTFKTRKNGADGGQSIAVSASTTGILEDTSNSDSLAVNDEFNYAVVTSTGGSSIVVRQIGCDLEYTGNTVQAFFAASGTTVSTSASSSNRFIFPFGHSEVLATEAENAAKLLGSGTIDTLFVRLSVNNTTTSDTNQYIRKNGADTAVNVTLTAATAGTFSDTSNSFTFANGDTIDYRVYKTETGSPVWRWMTFLIKYDAAAAGGKPHFYYAQM